MKPHFARLRTLAASLFLPFLLLLLLKNSAVAAAGVRRGLSLVADTLAPSLFPFLVLSELMLTTGAGEGLLQAARPLGRLLGVSPEGAASLLLGGLCGFPVGCVMAVGYRDKGRISPRELQRLFLFINTPSAGFLIGAVGSTLFGSTGVGVALFLITQSAALAVGLLLRLREKKAIAVAAAASAAVVSPSCAARLPAARDLTASVKRGFSTLLTVAAFVLFACAAVACLEAIPFIKKAPAVWRVLLCGTVELTAGTAAAVRELSAEAALCLCAFFAGFSGLSVCLQLFSVAEGQGLSVWRYLAAKLLQGLLCAGGARLYLYLCEPVLHAAPDAALPALSDGNAAPRLLTPAVLAAGIFLLCCLAAKIKKQSKRSG